MNAKFLLTFLLIGLTFLATVRATETVISEQYTFNFNESGYASQIISIPPDLPYNSSNGGIGINPTNVTGGLYVIAIVLDEHAEIYSNYTQYNVYNISKQVAYVRNGTTVFTNMTVGPGNIIPSPLIYNTTYGDPYKFQLVVYFNGQKGSISLYFYFNDDLLVLNSATTPYPIFAAGIPLIFAKRLRKIYRS